MKKRGLLIALLLICTVCILTACGGTAVKQTGKFSLNFDVDGSIVKTVSTLGNEAINLPPDPTKEDFLFDGWYYDKDTWSRPFTANSLLNESLTGSVTIYAKWIEDDSKYNTEGLVFAFDSENNGYILTGYNGDVTEVTVASKYNDGENGLLPVIRVEQGVFANCSGLTKMTLPFVGASLSGTSNTHFGYIFGASDYSGNNGYVPSSLKSVVITGGKSIGASAFDGCSGLTSVTIPNSVTSIGDGAFEDCSVLSSITVATDNTSYSSQDGILYNKAKTEFVHIPAKLSGDITIPSGITRIGQSVFSGYSGLTSIAIPNSVTSIGEYAFEGCSGLTYNIKDKVKYLGNNEKPYLWAAGVTDQNIGSITLDENCIGILSYAFEGCVNLVDITIPSSVISIGASAFSGCSKLTSITLPFVGASLNGTSNTHFGYIFGASDYSYYKNIVPSSLKSVVITGGNSIKSFAFSGCGGLTSITIPNSVISIGSFAFWDCCGLTSIVIPNSVTSIGANAFYGCSGLASITIGNSVTSIGNLAFHNCSGLTSITIPNSVTSIGPSAFDDCSKLTSIEIPDSVRSIGSYAFSGCSNLTYNIKDKVKYLGNNEKPYLWAVGVTNQSIVSITLDENCIGIYSYAFSECRGLTSINIGNSVTSIEFLAFNNCSGLTSITIPNSVTSISEGAFSGCSGLTTITVSEGNSVYRSEGNCVIEKATDKLIAGCKNSIIPNSVTSIGDRAFEGCGGLTSIEIPDSVTSIGYYAFWECSGLTSITIGNSVTSIGYYAFADCSGLTSIEIPDSVTSIGTAAFADCSELTSITIPSGVANIDRGAFDGCSNIQTIYCRAEKQPDGWKSDWKSGCNVKVVWGYKG